MSVSDISNDNFTDNNVSGNVYCHLQLSRDYLQGQLPIPGDKSISHRAIMLAGIAHGVSHVENLLTSEDIFSTITAMQQLGATITESANGFTIRGCGALGLTAPDNVIDMGNSGTSVRLLMGLVAAHPIEAFFTGDESLRKRPMARITTPLAKGGVQTKLREDRYLPLHLKGGADNLPIQHESKVASAQIKSALLLYGLNVNGRTSVIEPTLSRNHTEIMLQSFGAEVSAVQLADGRFESAVQGVQELRATDIHVPGDISSAAFLIVAALIVPDSVLTLSHVGLNPTRTGLLEVLQKMGASIEIKHQRVMGGEQVGDIIVKHSALQAIDLGAEIAPRMIDEYPILAVAASFAKGVSVMRGLGELKVKESNRLQAIYDGLQAVGMACKIGDDWLEVTGSNGKTLRGLDKNAPAIKTHHDHRIAMSFLLMGLGCKAPVYIDDTASIATSFPNFFELLAQIGIVTGE
ncbi:MAG: 3-phosphoshikimate 1-carboxyvinyltransferase [Alphaproteobacteria bacterium]|nr:3-phosphoshikimate 1-carboxyvinyltransferase [Alphaproteobacteria bacterium]